MSRHNWPLAKRVAKEWLRSPLFDREVFAEAKCRNSGGFGMAIGRALNQPIDYDTGICVTIQLENHFRGDGWSWSSREQLLNAQDRLAAFLA